MATEAELIAAQEYWYKRKQQDFWGSRPEYLAYMDTLTKDEQAFFSAENLRYNAIVEDQIQRERKTAKREHFQDFAVKAGSMIAAAFAAPVLFGPGTGGILGTGGSAAGIAGSGAEMDVAAAAMENQPWTDAASLAMENQVVTSSAGSFWDNLGGIVKAVPGAINTIANVLPKVEDIIGVFGGGDEPLTQPTSAPNSTQPIILQTGTGQQTGTTQPVFFQTPAAESGSPNMMLYIAIAAAAYFLLR